jgi:F0F1-type ATP synthase assembly protein I
VPFNSPSPDSENKRKPSPGLNKLVQAERLMQIAFVLPCAMLVGWGAGWAIDHYFHIHWAIVAGLVLGIVAGMVSAIRMAMDAMKPSGGSK